MLSVRGALPNVVACGIILTLVTIAWSAVAATVGWPAAPVAVLAFLALANLTLLGVVVIGSRPTPLSAAAAGTLGAAVALPWFARLLHPTVAADLPLPWIALTAGSAAALTVGAGRLLGPELLLLIAVATASALVWLSLTLGLLTLLGGPVDVAYARNERDWLGVWQLRGILGHPNAMGVVAVLALLLQLHLLRRTGFSRRGTIATLLVGPVASTVVLLWTQSRTAWIAAGAVLVLFLPWQGRRSRVLAVTVLTGAVALLIAPPVLGWAGVSFNGRDFPWSIAWHALWEAPFLGPGPRLFSPGFWDQYAAALQAPWEPAHAHNALLHAGVLLGLIGVAVVGSALAMAIAVAVGARRRDGGLALAVVCAWFTMAGVDPALGVGPGAAVYVPVLLVALVLSAAAVTVERGMAESHPPGEQPSTRAVPEGDLGRT